MVFQDLHNIEEKRALCLVFESMLPSEAVLLTHPGKTEGLAGKSAYEDVVLRDLFDWHLGNVVTGDLVVIAVIRAVGLASKAVPLRGEEALSSSRLKAQARTADPGEKIDETE
jgi:hypothetical protein